MAEKTSVTTAGPHCTTCQCAPHRRVGPGECSCGFNAYQLNEFVYDYGERLDIHLRAVERAR